MNHGGRHRGRSREETHLLWSKTQKGRSHTHKNKKRVTNEGSSSFRRLKGDREGENVRAEGLIKFIVV